MPYSHYNLAERKCLICGSMFKPLGSLHKNCKICIPDSTWATRYYNFGLSKPMFLAMMSDQNGMCGLCLEPLPENFAKICIDHCHETGLVRSLVHNRCNIGLSFIENSEFLSAAINYIDKHKEIHKSKVVVN